MTDSSLLRKYVESSARHLFRRCVQCQSGTPQCGSCPAGQECAYNSGDCNTCPYTACIASPNASSTSSSKSSSPAGPIAGGIIGGIALVAIVVGLVYWFYLRPKRQSWAVQHAADLSKESTTLEPESYDDYRSKRASVHTVHSFKTTGSRASIPIAYIPGVTGRGEAGSPDVIPPVPPIPAHGGSLNPGPSSPRINMGGEMFFRPDSTYTDAEFDRRSLAGRSMRSSYASEFYNTAIVDPMPPAHTAIAARATPISVQSPRSQSNTPNRTPNATPPPSHHNSIVNRMRSPAPSAGPITGTSGQARQITITRSNGNLRSANNNSSGSMLPIAELDDTSTGHPTPRMMASELDDTSIGSRTPRLLIDRSATASPRSMLSDDAEDLMRDGRWRRPSGSGPSGLRNLEVANEHQASIRNTIREMTSLAYGGSDAAMNATGMSPFGQSPQHSRQHSRNDSGAGRGAYESPFADHHATNM